MLFLAMLPNVSGILNINTQATMGTSSYLSYCQGGIGRHYIIDYDFKTYDDVLKRFGNTSKEKLFR